MPQDLDSTWIGRNGAGKWILLAIAIAAFSGSVITAAIGYGSLAHTVTTNTDNIIELKADDKDSNLRLLNLERMTTRIRQ